VTLGLGSRIPVRAVITFILILLLLSASNRSQAQENYPSTSWALGIVIPQGTGLEGGRTVQWGSVQNVTTDVTLPNISQPDQIVYAVLSMMTEDGQVLQVAAGVFPNSSVWLVYAWLFSDITSNPVQYQWILNSSLPEMLPNARVSISLFRSMTNTWELSVVDLDTDSSVERTFPSGIASSFKAGDQEVLALESYSRSVSTFQEMGNLTLNSLLIDGMKVSSGFYTFNGGWQPDHSPLFVIGTEGTVPPTFISLQKGTGNLVFWNYTNPWSNTELVYPVGIVTIIFLALLVGSIIIMASVILVTKRPKGDENFESKLEKT
jgi:hypothetical protein